MDNIKQTINSNTYLLKSLVVILITLVSAAESHAQDQNPYIRIVDLVIDSTHLVTFKAALKEDIETAVKIESGVISIYAVYDIDRPTHVIVFEVFESKKAHAIHQQTPHFEKYKNIIKNMVKSVKRTEVSPIVLGKNSIVPD